MRKKVHFAVILFSHFIVSPVIFRCNMAALSLDFMMLQWLKLHAAVSPIRGVHVMSEPGRSRSDLRKST